MDDSAPLMHEQWIRFFQSWRRELQKPIEINVEQIVGGGQQLTRVNDTNVTATLTGTPATALLKAVTVTLGWTGTLAAARLNANVVQAVTNDTNVTGVIAAQVLTLGWTGTLGVARGGTNIASYTVGDLLYASGATTLAKLADVAAGSYLRSGGVTTAPAWSTLTLPNSAATGDLLYASGANAMALRTIGSAADVLTVSGGLPVWAAPAAAATVTIVDDTTTNASMFPTWVTANSGNLPLKVTSTKLSFNPSTGMLSSTSLTLTGTLTTPHTTSAGLGIEIKGTTNFIHDYTNSDALANESASGYPDAYNVFVGVNAGNLTSSGSAGNSFGARNVGIGYLALNDNTTGWQNTAVGFISQEKTTTGLYNTSIGAYSLAVNTAGSNNTAIGADAMWKNQTGNDNACVGAYTLQQITTGSDNVAFGKEVLRNLTTASHNTALGSRAMDAHTTGADNVAIGYNALGASLTCANNVAIGLESLRTTTASTVNTGLGSYTLFALTSGARNVAAGFAAGESITTGNDNTIVGYFGGDLLTTGTGNVLIGNKAGDNLTTGSSNIIIGNDINSPAAATVSNQMSIGNLLFSLGIDGTGGTISSGGLGIGVNAPTATCHLRAGTATASTAPLKFNSGTNLTTAEAGAMEYNGTNLFFTRAGTVRENVLVAIDNVAAPTTSIGVAIVNYYGANATNYLGDPNRWLSVNVLGTTYKIPLYT